MSDHSSKLRAIITALEETETTLAAGRTVPSFSLSAAAQLMLMSKELEILATAVYATASPVVGKFWGR